MRNKLQLLFFLLISATASGQYFSWAVKEGGAAPDLGVGITTDISGNVYTVGNFSGTATFGEGNNTVSFTASGIQDVFITKMSPTGDLIWAKVIGGADNDVASDIKVDDLGNVFVTGNCYGVIDADPGVAVVNLPFGGVFDGFVVKLDNNGNYLWGNSFGGGSNDAVNAIEVTSNGECILVGSFSQTVDFDPGVGVYNLTSTGVYDIFIVKLDQTGSFVWGESIGGTNFDEAQAVALDANENIYVSGYFKGTVDFAPGSNVYNLSATGSFTSAFIVKLTPNGGFVMARNFAGNNGSCVANNIVIDPSGKIITSGFFSETIDFDPGSSSFNLTGAGAWDCFITKLDLGGDFEWAKSLGGPYDDFIEGINLDVDGNLYLTGSFRDVIDIDPGVGTSYYGISGNSTSMLTSKFDVNGNMVWGHVLSQSAGITGKSISVDANGEIYSTGAFASSSNDFDPTSGVSLLSADGYADVFIQKWSQTSPCYVTIPDVNFKNHLLANAAINTDGDTEISCAEASTYVGGINCSSLGIADLTGIEDFVLITDLNFEDNDVVNVDLTNNVNIENLMCRDNQLTALDISQNINLLELDCSINQLSSLDVTANSLLTDLRFEGNSVGTIDLSNCTELVELHGRYNNLTSLDLINNHLLQNISCSNNQIGSIDLNNGAPLVTISFAENQVNAIDLSAFTSLVEVICTQNLLTTLDFSNNPNLIRLYASNNQLSSLNVANGNNINITYFFTENNPDLICIDVDDAVYSSANWTDIDPVSSFSTNCFISVEEIAGDKVDLKISPNPVNNYLSIDAGNANDIHQIKIIDCVGRVVKTIQHSIESINISDLSPGSYTILVYTDNGLAGDRFIKK